ncbi:UNVERIFIED_CONTAM: hypothetical protein FKN15_018096 [Acipenser sinensis]
MAPPLVCFHYHATKHLNCGKSPYSSGELKVQWVSSDPMTKPLSSFTPRNWRAYVSKHLASGVCCSMMEPQHGTESFIPPPLIFGAGIDSTCLIWSTVCGEDGACMLYDNTAYRYLYVSIAIALKTFAFILYTTTWLCLRRNYKSYIKNHEGGLNPSEMFASTLTLDNLGRDASQNPPDRTKFIYNLEAHEWCENMESVL